MVRLYITDQQWHINRTTRNFQLRAKQFPCYQLEEASLSLSLQQLDGDSSTAHGYTNPSITVEKQGYQFADRIKQVTDEVVEFHDLGVCPELLQ